MQRAAEARDAAMAAVVKLPGEEAERLCAGFREVWPVNYNCPGQVTVSGSREEMAAFAAALASAALGTPRIPVYANLTGEPYGADVAGTLTKT